MHRRICTWIIPLFVVLEGTALADGILRRGPKPNPAEHVPALIKTLDSDFDDRRRADAAANLRDYDLKTFPEIIPALVEALKNDPSIAVRMEAAHSIGRLRPISQMGGYALEQAEVNDPAIRVRAIANLHLKTWVVVHGYKKGRMPEPYQTEEPPLADPLPPPLPKNGAMKMPKVMYGVQEPIRDLPQLLPPQLPPQFTASPRNERFIGQLMKRIKPDVNPRSGDDGPSLGPPR